MWKRALETNPDIPSPMAMIGTEKLISCIVWMENQSAPASVLEQIICTYRKSTPTNCCQFQCKCTVPQLLQTVVSFNVVRVLSMECSDVCKC